MKHLVIRYLGSIGSRHYRILQELGEEVCGVDSKDNNLYADKSVCEPDMIWICTPNSSHYLYALDCKEGKKLFIEKPVTDNLKQAELLKEWKSPIWVACNYRFHPAVQTLKESLPKVGKVLYARLHFSHYLPYQRENWQEYIKGTNIVMDAGWHFVDLALWLFGDVEYKSFSYQARKELGIIDFVSIYLGHYEDNVSTTIHLDYLRRDKSWGVEVVGTEGTLILESHFKGISFQTLGLFKNNKLEIILNTINADPDKMFRNQIKYLLTENWKSNINDAVEVMKICS